MDAIMEEEEQQSFVETNTFIHKTNSMSAKAKD
jgi:hypothetical protein